MFQYKCQKNTFFTNYHHKNTEYKQTKRTFNLDLVFNYKPVVQSLAVSFC